MSDNEIKINVKQEQIHDLLFGKELSWQEIIYDLINTEQLNPWDINVVILTEKYLEKIKELEEADFFISSKVLLAAALLVRIKSEILLSREIKSIDDILFERKEEKKYVMERIELEDEIPNLVPRSPIPRFRRVTLNELMESLNKAIVTENRRIQKEILNRNALRESSFSLPKKTISIKDKIKEIYERFVIMLNKTEEKKKIPFSKFSGDNKEDKVYSFVPLLHLEHQKKLWLHQDAHFEEIYIWLKDVYFEHMGNPYEDLRDEIESISENFDEEQKKRLDEINSDFENPLGDFIEKDLQ